MQKGLFPFHCVPALIRVEQRHCLIDEIPREQSARISVLKLHKDKILKQKINRLFPLLRQRNAIGIVNFSSSSTEPFFCCSSKSNAPIISALLSLSPPLQGLWITSPNRNGHVGHQALSLLVLQGHTEARKG